MNIKQQQESNFMIHDEADSKPSWKILIKSWKFESVHFLLSLHEGNNDALWLVIVWVRSPAKQCLVCAEFLATQTANANSVVRSSVEVFVDNYWLHRSCSSVQTIMIIQHSFILQYMRVMCWCRWSDFISTSHQCLVRLERIIIWL